ncbi:MAG: hypothetical protein KA885_07500 [Spirochaetes bacterium]|nr:hypothetical protein [Spirochaetota bacterium]
MKKKKALFRGLLKRAIYNRIRQKENIKVLMIIEDTIINQYTRDEILKWR